MPERYLLLPILNKHISTRTPVLALTDGVAVRTIADEHFGAIFDQAPGRIRDAIHPGGKCLYVTLGANDDPETKLKLISVLARYTMNFLADRGPLTFAFGIHAEKKRKFKVVRTFNLPAGTDRDDLAAVYYRMRQSVSPEDVKPYYEVGAKAIQSNGTLLLALGRLNSFLANQLSATTA